MWGPDPNVTAAMWSRPMLERPPTLGTGTGRLEKGCGGSPRRRRPLCRPHPWGDACHGPTVAVMAVNGPLVGRRALITGGASGIGKACAVRLAGDGAEVVVVDRDAEAAKAVAAEVGGTAVAVDLSDLAAVDALDLDVDVLVNNAGFQHVAPVHEFPVEVFSTIQRLMVEAPF